MVIKFLSKFNRFCHNLNPDQVLIWVFGFELFGLLHFEFGQIQKIRQQGLDIGQQGLCDFGVDFLQNFMKTTLDNWIRILKNRVQVPSHIISFRMSKNHIKNLDNQVQTSNIWIWVQV